MILFNNTIIARSRGRSGFQVRSGTLSRESTL